MQTVPTVYLQAQHRLCQNLLQPLERPVDLAFGYCQWRSETDGVLVSLVAEYPLVDQPDNEGSGTAEFVLQLDAFEQSSAPDLLDVRAPELLQFSLEVVAHLKSSLCEVLVLDQPEGCQGSGTVYGVALEGASVLGILQYTCHLVIADGRRQLSRSSAQELAENQDIRLCVLVLVCKPLSAAAQPCLDLIPDEEYIVLLAYPPGTA